MKKYSLLLVALAVMPFLAHAQLGNIEDIVASIGRIVDLATPIVVGLALLVFFWGLVKFIFSAGNEDNKEDGKRLMIYGVIALFVIVAIAGILNFIKDAIGLDDDTTLTPPRVEGL